MRTVENIKATRPVITELDSSVSSTLIPTFPHRTVVNKKLTSLRNASTFNALGLPESASTSSRSRLIPSNARLRPENIADWLIQNRIPIQTSQLNGSISINYSPRNEAGLLAPRPRRFPGQYRHYRAPVTLWDSIVISLCFQYGHIQSCSSGLSMPYSWAYWRQSICRSRMICLT